MTKDYKTPLKVSIVNKGNNKEFFVPCRENQVFPIEANGQVSFTVNSSEVGLYYAEQIGKKLEVSIADGSSSTVVKSGSYDLDNSTFNSGASFSSILKESSEVEEQDVKTVTEKFEVIGTLPYSEATPAIGMPAGNRFTVQFSYPGIAELPSGKIANVTIEGGTSIDYTKSAFEDDLSLVTIINANKGTKLTVTVKWSDEYEAVYEFTFADVKLAADGEEVKHVEDIEFDLPCQVELENIGNNTIKFIPYHENFEVEIAKEDKVILDSNLENEVFYYLLQASKDLKVSIK